MPHRGGITMKRYVRAACSLALGAASRTACRWRRGRARRSPIAIVGPITGQYASFGAADEGRRARWPSRTSTPPAACSARSSMLDIGDDACDPKQAVAVANQMAGKGVALVAGHYCSGSSIPASKVYAESDMVQISPASTNPNSPTSARARASSRLRPRRPAGRHRRRIPRQAVRRPEHRHRRRQDRLRQRPRRRDQEGA